MVMMPLPPHDRRGRPYPPQDHQGDQALPRFPADEVSEDFSSSAKGDPDGSPFLLPLLDYVITNFFPQRRRDAENFTGMQGMEGRERLL
jgi:hypothetical protein